MILVIKVDRTDPDTGGELQNSKKVKKKVGHTIVWLTEAEAKSIDGEWPTIYTIYSTVHEKWWQYLIPT